jgi:hypothetical protein
MSPLLRAALGTHGHDGRILCRVLRTLLRARAEAVYPNTPPLTFPFTEDAFTRVARCAGTPVGQKHARRLIALAISSGLIVRDDSYKARRGYRVPLYRLGCRITRMHRRGDGNVGADALRFAQEHTAVGTGAVVKPRRRRERVRFWLDGLMGMPDGLPPPEAVGSCVRARRLRRWRPRSEAVTRCP